MQSGVDQGLDDLRHELLGHVSIARCWIVGTSADVQTKSYKIIQRNNQKGRCHASRVGSLYIFGMQFLSALGWQCIPRYDTIEQYLSEAAALENRRLGHAGGDFEARCQGETNAVGLVPTTDAV